MKTLAQAGTGTSTEPVQLVCCVREGERQEQGLKSGRECACTLYSVQGLMLLTQIVLPKTITGSAVPAAVIVVRCVIVIWLCADVAPPSASASAGAAIVQ